MTIPVDRSHGTVTYHCPIKDCSYWTYTWKYLKNHLKETHPFPSGDQIKLDSIKIFQVMKNEKK